MRRLLLLTLVSAALGCNGNGDDGDCPPGQQRIGIYCFDPVGDGGQPPGDGGGSDDAGRDAGQPPDDAGPPDTGITLPDAGGPPDIGPVDGSVVTPGQSGRYLIRGSVVLTMATDEHAPGEVYVESGSIACVGTVGDCTGQAAGATIIDTGAIVMPGLVDAHNHLAFNWLPEWEPGRLFNDHTHWQGSSSYDSYVAPYSDNRGDTPSFCAMLEWGELRSLVNGTTTAMGAPQARTCIRWLVRNPELSTGYNGWDEDRMRTNTLGVGQLDATEAAELATLMDTGEVTAYMLHLAEGISVRAHDEYVDLVGFDLLRPETKIIHGTALTAADLMQVGQAGSPIIWSPSSNMVLYGETLDIPAAVAAGVSISLSADWTLSGSDDLLHEARFARILTETRWPGTFTDREYVEMITVRAAEHMAIDRFVGTLETGKHADLVVLTGDASTPYNSVIEARPGNVRFVMIGGIPSYGEPAIMDAMIDKPSSCHQLDACGAPRTACWDDTPAGPVSPDSIAQAITGFYAPGPLDLFDCQ